MPLVFNGGETTLRKPIKLQWSVQARLYFSDQEPRLSSLCLFRLSHCKSYQIDQMIQSQLVLVYTDAVLGARELVCVSKTKPWRRPGRLPLSPHVVGGPGPGTQRHALRSTKALRTQEYVSLVTKHMSLFDFWQG